MQKSHIFSFLVICLISLSLVHALDCGEISFRVCAPGSKSCTGSRVSVVATPLTPPVILMTQYKGGAPGKNISYSLTQVVQSSNGDHATLNLTTQAWSCSLPVRTNASNSDRAWFTITGSPNTGFRFNVSAAAFKGESSAPVTVAATVPGNIDNAITQGTGFSATFNQVLLPSSKGVQMGVPSVTFSFSTAFGFFSSTQTESNKFSSNARDFTTKSHSSWPKGYDSGSYGVTQKFFSTSGDDSLSVVEIIFIVIGIVLVAVAICIFAYWLHKRCGHKSHYDEL